MLSLDNIEPEIVSLILEFIEDTSPRTTKAVACVNKYLNGITQLIAHRHKIVNIRGRLDIESASIRNVQSWLNNEVVLANIRTLTVKGWVEPVDDDQSEPESDADEDDEDDEDPGNKVHESLLNDQYWNVLATLLAKIGRLRRFSWNIRFPIPLPVLKAFEENQRFSTLRVYRFTRAVPNLKKLDDAETRLARSTALTHFRYGCNETENPSYLEQLAFRGIVGSAPNLEYAGIVTAACSEYPEEDSESFRPLFFQQTKPNASVKVLTLDGVDVSKLTLEDWSTTIDLNSLQVFKHSRGLPTLDYFQNAATMLPNLKSLSLNMLHIQQQVSSSRDMRTAIQNYLESCSPLHTLSLWSYANVVNLDPILQKHGATLTNLQLHERDISYITQREVLDLAAIKFIRSTCPNLQFFTFDVNRSNYRLIWDKDANRECYEEVAKFKHLNQVQIYLDCGLTYIVNVPRSFGATYSFTDHSDSEDDNDNDDDAANISSQTTSNVPALSTNTNLVQKNNETSPLATSSIPPAPPLPDTAPRPAKKPRISDKPIPPSRDRYLGSYTKRIWNTVFANKCGARILEVKVGEWESRTSSHAFGFVRHLIARPHERDDVHEPVVVINTKARSSHIYEDH